MAHRVVCYEVGDRIFELQCECGWRSWTPWGQEAAAIAAEKHQLTRLVYK